MFERSSYAVGMTTRPMWKYTVLDLNAIVLDLPGCGGGVGCHMLGRL